MKAVHHIPLIEWDSDPLSESDIVSVENAIGTLPADYREFLKQANGGRPIAEVKNQLPESSGGYTSWVTEFTVIEAAFPPPVFEIEFEGKQYRLIQIASCYDSSVLMQIAEHKKGGIYYWDPYQLEDLEDESIEYLDCKPAESDLVPLAPSFTAFIDGLVCISEEKIPSLDAMEPTVENFSKFGDHYFEAAKSFFDKLTTEELNQNCPNHNEFAFQPIAYAARWSQVRIVKLLIDRGVDIHVAVTQCTNNFEITKLLIEAGATEKECRELLLTAAASMPATSVPSENYKIIRYLLERGIQPDFSDSIEREEWKTYTGQIYTKKIISFLLSAFEFPADIANPMRRRLATRLT